jgi:hypothetical protein
MAYRPYDPRNPADQLLAEGQRLLAVRRIRLELPAIADWDQIERNLRERIRMFARKSADERPFTGYVKS